MSSAVPDELTLKVNRDREARRDVHWRRVLVSGLVVFLLLGLANVFGQRPSTHSVASPRGSLSLYAPTKVRSGLYFEARFHVGATRELKDAQLVLDPGWAEGITINTIEPSPDRRGEPRRQARPRPRARPGGRSYVLFLQIQVNPTNVGPPLAGRRPLRRRHAGRSTSTARSRSTLAWTSSSAQRRLPLHPPPDAGVGRRELSSLEPFDLILLVVIGDLVQQGVTQNDFSVTG